jgi:hypothetical protein
MIIPSRTYPMVAAEIGQKKYFGASEWMNPSFVSKRLL